MPPPTFKFVVRRRYHAHNQIWRCPYIWCVTKRSLATLEDRSSIPEVGMKCLLFIPYHLGKHWWSLCVTLARSLHPLIKTLSRYLNTGATIQPDRSREIIYNKGIHYISIQSHDGSTYPVKNELDRVGGRVTKKKRCNFLWVRSLYELHVSSLLTQQAKLGNGSGAPRGFITKYTSVWHCVLTDLCCHWSPYSTTNKGEVWALQETCRTASVNPNHQI